MSVQTLEDKIALIGNPVDMLRNAQTGPYVFPIKAEFSNWRDEQEAWRKSAVLLDQSLHMTDLYMEGPDCYRLLSNLAVNSFSNFGPMKAKQIVVCSQTGHVIGDSILFGLAENKVQIVGRPPTSNWIDFNAQTGHYDVKTWRDERSLQNPKERATYRFQVQGPTAGLIFEKVHGGPLPDIKFFHIGEIKVGRYTVMALNHQMSGFPGYELWGPANEGEAVKSILMDAGAEFDLKLGGARCYSTVAIESGWIPSPTPAIYSGEHMKPYRQWLTASGFEANASIGGSFDSARIEDYYQTPWDLGYDTLIKFDHEFIGRKALEQMAQQKHRRKVWLYWAKDDVLRVMGSMYNEGDTRFKYLDMPAAHYATLPLDRILKNGKLIGLSTYPVYSSNVRSWMSLCMVDEEHAVYGDEVSVVWGEPAGGTAKPVVERHLQTEIKATIRPKPFSQLK